MSQKTTPDSSQKGFAVGRGLLAAAETLNFSMGESLAHSYGSSTQQHSGLMGLGGGNSQERDSHQPPHRVSNPLSNTMKLFASLGLSPNDLDVLAQVPEENISVETLPQLIKQLKNRKPDANRPLALDLSQSLSPEPSYRGGRDEWGDMQGGRLDCFAASTSQGDFGYSSSQDVSTRGFDMRDSSSIRERQYSELTGDTYRGSGMSSAADDLFLPRRIGAPSQGKIQDFLGVIPLMFPHVCSLCDFDVHSIMEWTQHTTTTRHAENRRVLLQLYPDWDPHMSSGRMSDSLKGRSDGLLGAAPLGTRQRAGMSSSWGSDLNMGMTGKMSYSVTPKIRSRVVVIKYDQKPKLSHLFSLASRFGTIRENLVLKNKGRASSFTASVDFDVLERVCVTSYHTKSKAFLEFQSHEEALAMANHYQHKPAILHGNKVKIYLSKELLVIEKNDRQDRDRNLKQDSGPVVFFSNLPRETEKKSELLTIARRFGTVVNHLFLNDQAFVQMSNPDDAEMLVKYYTIHPLTISRRSIQLNICTKYKTLTVVPGRGEQIKEGREEGAHRKSSSRISSKTSSRPQKASSSKAKESPAEVIQQSKAEEVEEQVVAAAECSDDENGGVEAHDKTRAVQEEATVEKLAEDSVILKSEKEPLIVSEDATKEKAVKGEEVAEKDDTKQELQSEEPAEHESIEDQENAELKDTDSQDEATLEDYAEQEEMEESEFPEDMDEFVTLDELADDEEAEFHDSTSKDKTASGKSRHSGGMRVVNVNGFKRSYGYLDEILALAKPFGKVVRHLVLHSRPEAFLELGSEQEARAMVRFYNGNVIPSVCGKTVKIYHSMTYATIQSGKVIYVGHIPPFKSADTAILKIVEPFGKIRRYYMNRVRNECFIEMMRGEDAERFVEAAKLNPHRFEGKRLLVYISRKYKQLKHGHRPPSPDDKRPAKREHSDEEQENESSSSEKTSSKHEEPPTKKLKEENPSVEDASVPEEMEGEGVSDVKEESTEEHSKGTTDAENKSEPKAGHEELGLTSDTSLAAASEKDQETSDPPSIPAEPVKRPEVSLDTLGPYEPNVPVGVEFVKMGYYCRVCFLFYSNEDTAKKAHCSSQAHYEKLKKHLEKEKAKTQSNGEKN